MGSLDGRGAPVTGRTRYSRPLLAELGRPVRSLDGARLLDIPADAGGEPR